MDASELWTAAFEENWALRYPTCFPPSLAQQPGRGDRSSRNARCSFITGRCDAACVVVWAQGHKIHAIPRPVSHPRIPGNGNNIMKKRTAIPVPWPPTGADTISAGTPTRNSEHGTLIATVDMIVASRRDFSEDGCSINASRAKPYSHRKGQHVRVRRIG